jgi:alkylation response protein AidB-like acyl-CoA dehydrogenase
MSEITEASLRAEVRAWLEANWNPDLGLVEWRSRLIDAGWGAPGWPRAWYGRALPAALASVVDQEIRRIGAVGVAGAGPRGLAAQTLLAHGSDFLKEKFLKRSLTGEDGWCQLFSEPGSGSDLAGAMTRANFRDGQWIVNGQKVWTTSAHHADWGFLLARTSFDVPKHQGLSYFIIDMRQKGVTVQPLRQMNGHASFNQVFFTDALVPKEHLVGEIGGGWAVATTTLMHERRGFDSAGARGGVPPKREGRIYEEERAEAAVAMEPYKWYPQRAGRVDLILKRAKESGRINDPVVLQEIAKLLILARSAEWTARRARAAMVEGRAPGPEGSLGKLAASIIARAAARVHTLISGADAMLSGEDSPMDGLIAEILISVPAISIAGGTDEIQKNIIAERVLKMPREHTSVDEMAFKDVPKNVIG